MRLCRPADAIETHLGRPRRSRCSPIRVSRLCLGNDHTTVYLIDRIYKLQEELSIELPADSGSIKCWPAAIPSGWTINSVLNWKTPPKAWCRQCSTASDRYPAIVFDGRGRGVRYCHDINAASQLLSAVASRVQNNESRPDSWLADPAAVNTSCRLRGTITTRKLLPHQCSFRLYALDAGGDVLLVALLPVRLQRAPQSK